MACQWELFRLTAYDLAIFADADLELFPPAEHDPTWAGAVWVHTITRLLASPTIQLLVDPDPKSPFNAGLFLLKPNAALYDDGLAALRRWLFYYMTFVRHRIGAYGAAARGVLPLSRHWWAGFKPWMEIDMRASASSTPAISPATVAGMEPLLLAKLYDYVVQLEPSRRPQLPRPHEKVPRCVSLQRQMRRRIEESDVFEEVAAIWQEHLRSGDGYSAWPTLPGEGLPGG